MTRCVIEYSVSGYSRFGLNEVVQLLDRDLSLLNFGDGACNITPFQL